MSAQTDQIEGTEQEPDFIYVRAGRKLSDGQNALLEDDKRHPGGTARVIKGDPFAETDTVYPTEEVNRKIKTGDLDSLHHIEGAKAVAAQKKRRAEHDNAAAEEKATAPAAPAMTNDQFQEMLNAALETQRIEFEKRIDAILEAIDAPAPDDGEDDTGAGSTGGTANPNADAGATGPSGPATSSRRSGTGATGTSGS